MSASVQYANDEAARMWNSSFHILHKFLKLKASTEPLAQRIVEENPIAGELKFLNLETLTRSDLVSFIGLLELLEVDAPTLSLEWNQPDYIGQFMTDLTETKLRANKALLATDGEP